MTNVEELELQRLKLQASLDSQKTQVERNKLGQFATPPSLASDVIEAALSHISPKEKIRFLDPAFGTGSFYSALLRHRSAKRVSDAAGFEIDLHYGQHAVRLWSGSGLKIGLTDFTRMTPPASESAKFNCVVCNPPYVRHHHLSQDQKRHLLRQTELATGYSLSGLSGLYCYFMLLSQSWMAQGGIGIWLIPSEFMDVNYGSQIKSFLLDRVSLLHVHRFDPSDVQFDDALVSSAVVIFKNSPPAPEHRATFSFGGGISTPRDVRSVGKSELRSVQKWTSFPSRSELDEPSVSSRLSDYFTVKRGIATGCNNFFVLSSAKIKEFAIPSKFLRPVLPSPRNLEVDEIEANGSGEPLIEHRRFLLNCREPEDHVRHNHPGLWEYLQTGVREGVRDRYLCRHREPWYSQEERPAAPFLCTYMGRKTATSEAPFRFILNHSRATAANVYLMMYPKPELTRLVAGNAAALRRIWQGLSSITPEMMTGEGRIYGGGLHKMEPKELANVPADVVLKGIPREARKQQRSLLFT